MADIFLSYNETDRDAVRRLALALQSVGWSVWWDRRIPAGQTWRSVLAHEMQAMRCMVVVWSAKSVQSEWVCEEADEGRQSGKLVPVMIERVRPPAGFREIQAADLIGWDGTADFPGLQQLIEDISRLVHRPSAPAPPPAAAPEASPAFHVSRRVWGFAAGALLLALGAGYFVENWRKADSPVEAPMATTAAPPVTSPVTPDASSPRPTPSVADAAKRPTAAAAPMPAPPRPVAKPATGANPRCAALRERQQLGEALSDASKRFYQQEC